MRAFSSIILFLSAALVFAQEFENSKYPWTKEEANRCLINATKARYQVSCTQSAEQFTSKGCQELYRLAFEENRPTDANGLLATALDEYVPQPKLDASKFFRFGGEEALYLKAAGNVAKKVDKKLLAASLSAWAFEGVSWYMFFSGKLAMSAAASGAGWLVTAGGSSLLLKNVKDLSVQEFSAASEEIAKCKEDIISDETLKKCIQQHIPQEALIEILQGLLTGDEIVTGGIRAFASEGYAWESPGAPARAACGMVSTMAGALDLLLKADVKCDAKTGKIRFMGQNYTQKTSWAGNKLISWSLESDSAFYETQEGVILKKKKLRKVRLQMLGGNQENNTDNDIVHDASMESQARLLAHKFLADKNCLTPQKSYVQQLDTGPEPDSATAALIPAQ